MFFAKKQFQPQKLDNGVIRTIKGYTDDLMVCELVWKKGQTGSVHAHPHTQCGYIISGKFEAEVNGEKQILAPGECFYTKPNEAHGLVCLEDGMTLDVFTPKREDFLK